MRVSKLRNCPHKNRSFTRDGVLGVGHLIHVLNKGHLIIKK